MDRLKQAIIYFESHNSSSLELLDVVSIIESMCSNMFDWLVGWFMVFNATFNIILVISWQSVLLVEEMGVHDENHRPAISH